MSTHPEEALPNEDEQEQKIEFNEDSLVAELEAMEQVAAAATAEEESAPDAIDKGEKMLAELPEERRSFLAAAMETLLFMHDKPVSLPRLRALIDNTVALPVYRRLMQRLKEEFARDHRGVEIAEVSLGFQLRTKPHMAVILRNLVKTQPLKLTSTMMEALAVVAYKQPVTKDELDQIRGVDCGYLLRSLMEKKLVNITGRSDLPGRPILYATTHQFLELFSLKDLTQLPPLFEIENMVAASEVGVDEDEQNKLLEFGQMVEKSLGTVLFDDSMLDGELESIREAIDGISTSTEYLDAQKASERWNIKVAALQTQGLTEEQILEQLGPEPLKALLDRATTQSADAATPQSADAATAHDAIAAEMVAASLAAEDVTIEKALEVAPPAPAELEGVSFDELHKHEPEAEA